jgi:uncharacterized membrane protein
MEDQRFVPHVSVTVGLLLALAGVAVLIYFIHHAASSIQAEQVIAGVSRDLRDALNRLYPKEIGDSAEAPAAAAKLPEDFDSASVDVPAGASDYLQAVDGDRLMSLAIEHDLVLKVVRRPGQFVTRGNPLVRAWPADHLTKEADDAVQSAFYLGSRRTLLQDIEFAIDQLVEVALRALSPGINDPFTAIACVDRLGAALSELGGREIPTPYRFDDEGRLRIVASGATASGIVESAFNQIRQASHGNAAVTLRLLEVMAAVAPRVRTPEFRGALLRQARAVRASGEDGLQADMDRTDVEERFAAVLAALGEQS